MKEIALYGKLGLGMVALVDDEDYALVSHHKWYLSHGYATTTFHRKGSSRSDKDRNVNLAMHRLILNIDGQVDHRNRDRLDNQRGNLRPASNQQNTWNSSVGDSRSGYVGVYIQTPNVYHAVLSGTSLGYYATAIEAAQARDLAALKERGEFAVLNFPAAELPELVTPLPPRNTGERTSTTVGVSYAKNRKAKQKWRAVRKKEHLGWFTTEAGAVLAIKEAL